MCVCPNEQKRQVKIDFITKTIFIHYSFIASSAHTFNRSKRATNLLTFSDLYFWRHTCEYSNTSFNNSQISSTNDWSFITKWTALFRTLSTCCLSIDSLVSTQSADIGWSLVTSWSSSKIFESNSSVWLIHSFLLSKFVCLKKI